MLMLAVFTPWRALLCLITLLTLVIPAGATAPQRLQLDNFALETEDDRVHARLAVSIDSLSGLRSLLRDGAQLQFRCEGLLTEQRTVMPNRTLGETTQEHDLRYDTRTREFVILAEGRAPLRDRNLERLLGTVWGSIDLPLGEAKVFAPNANYRLRITLSLKHTQVPPWLEQTLFFWSWDVVPSATFTQDLAF